MPRVTTTKKDEPIAQAPETAPEPVRPTRQIVRKIETVMIEVPICTNPPGVELLHGSRAAHINTHLLPSKTKRGRLILHQLYHALMENGTKLANGKPITSRNHAVVWLIEQLDQGG